MTNHSKEWGSKVELGGTEPNGREPLEFAMAGTGLRVLPQAMFSFSQKVFSPSLPLPHWFSSVIVPRLGSLVLTNGELPNGSGVVVIDEMLPFCESEQEEGEPDEAVLFPFNGLPSLTIMPLVLEMKFPLVLVLLAGIEGLKRPVMAPRPRSPAMFAEVNGEASEELRLPGVFSLGDFVSCATGNGLAERGFVSPGDENFCGTFGLT